MEIAVAGPLSTSACHASVCTVYRPLQADMRPFTNQIPKREAERAQATAAIGFLSLWRFIQSANTY